MKIPDKVRYFNKRFTNRLMIKIAGKPFSPIALIRHYGRKSGNVYLTPIMAVKNGNGFVFALTYGKNVDWFNNIVSKGSGELLWKGCWYSLVNPQEMTAMEAGAVFPKPERMVLNLLKIEDYFQMKFKDS